MFYFSWLVLQRFSELLTPDFLIFQKVMFRIKLYEPILLIDGFNNPKAIPSKEFNVHQLQVSANKQSPTRITKQPKIVA